MNSALSRLDILVGEWLTRASVAGQPVGVVHTTFRWLDAGPFLMQRAVSEPPLPTTPPEWVANSPFPVTAIVGLDDTTDTFGMLYADVRGVCRNYRMTLVDDEWKIRGRPGPDFHQRFTGIFSPDRDTITAYWESSQDGTHWEKDFDLTYTREK